MLSQYKLFNVRDLKAHSLCVRIQVTTHPRAISMGRAFRTIPWRPHLGSLGGLLKSEGELPVVQTVRVNAFH